MGEAAKQLAEAPKASRELATGSASLTIKLRKEYGAYNKQAQVGGEAPVPWETWVVDQGYELDRRGLAYPKG